VTTVLRTRSAALLRAWSPLRWVTLDLDGLDLDLTVEDLVPVRERPWPRWPTLWPGYRGDPVDTAA
jgi:hypothetical protein